MAEREALQWQIQLLQNLIDRHKRVHGDATVPFSEAHTRTGSTSSAAGTGPGTTAGTRLGASLTFLGGAHSLSLLQKPRSSCGFMLGPRSQSGSWRKTYSLKNKISLASSQTQTQRHSQSATPKASLKPSAASQRHQPRLGPDSASDLPPCSTASTQGLQTNKPTTAALKPDKTLDRPSQSQNKTSGVGSFFSYSCNSSLKRPAFLKPTPSTKTPSPASLKDVTSENDPTTKTRVSSALENAGTESQRCVNFSNPSDPEGKTLLSKQNATASVKPTEMKKSLSAPLNGLKPEGSSSVSGCPATAEVKHSNLRKRAAPRASALSAPALKRVKNCSDTTCFTWVRPAPGLTQGKHRQGPSPGSEYSGGDSGSDPIRRHSLSALSGTSSRYQWVSRVNRPRPGPGLSPQVSSSPGPKVSPKDRSRFKWSAPQRSEVTAGSAAVAVETGGSSGFKLQSRTKIIRRNNPGPGPSVVLTPSGRKPGLKPRSGPVRTRISVSRHKLRRISPVQTRTTDLVSVSRHKLRRTGSGVSLPQRVLWSRFKMEKRTVVGPDLGWRSRRVQIDKTFRQIRLRSPASDQTRARPIVSQGWSSNVCWIRGSLYRVSANRLSRTTARNTLGIPPTGSTHLFPAAAVARSSSRHMAKSVLQRSLSIARASHLKQRQRQFCMFYNRFGRCNRGDQCPFIHDPEKVAVCTRFLRGRCKEDDSCQFSHKVSKDKMPVCSFFLRGVCSNSECPYSHVYVSRNAQICQDFVRGYCPLGQKCKKKHTLVCSDANCCRGDACKLQHKLIRRSAGRKPHPHSKRNKLTPQTSDPASVSDLRPGSGLSPGLSPRPRPLQKLPSFISLCSSPEEPEAPQTTGGAALHKGRILQIKPRL